MSRRDDHDSDYRRHHRPKLDRESSPKRSRRDEKTDADTVSRNNRTVDADQDQKRRRQLRDSSPPDTSVALDSKVDSAAVSKESRDNKTNGLDVSLKNISERKENISERKEVERKDLDSINPSGSRRSHYLFQNDERDSAGRVGRSYSSRAINERGRQRDSRDQHDDRTINRTRTNGGTWDRDDRSHARKADDNVWRHNGFYQLETAPPPPPPRQRPAFSEKKIIAETESRDRATNETGKHNRPDQPVLSEGRREETFRGGDNGHRLNGAERQFDRDRRPSNRENPPRRGGPTREGYGGRRDQFGARQGNYQPGGRADKWKHDLYDEANKSPTRKNEEDQIAKVEALLSS